jgi:hypothetical protein
VRGENFLALIMNNKKNWNKKYINGQIGWQREERE